MPPEVAEVRAGDVPHVDGRVVAGGQQQPPRQRGRHAREARVRGRGLVLLDLLVAADIPQPEIDRAFNQASRSCSVPGEDPY